MNEIFEDIDYTGKVQAVTKRLQGDDDEIMDKQDRKIAALTKQVKKGEESIRRWMERYEIVKKEYVDYKYTHDFATGPGDYYTKLMMARARDSKIEELTT